MLARLALAVAGVALTALLPACDASNEAAVTGSVTYRERMAIGPDAEIVVRLVDVSKQDAPAETIAEKIIRADGKQVPFPFTLTYDSGEIVESNRYAVQAEITDEGRRLFLTTSSYPVVTGGNPTEDVEIVLERVG